VVCQLIMYNYAFVGITISRNSFVFSQPCIQVSASLTDMTTLAVRAFDLVNCSLSVVGFVSVINIGQYVVVGLWVTRML